MINVNSSDAFGTSDIPPTTEVTGETDTPTTQPATPTTQPATPTTPKSNDPGTNAVNEANKSVNDYNKKIDQQVKDGEISGQEATQKKKDKLAETQKKFNDLKKLEQELKKKGEWPPEEWPPKGWFAPPPVPPIDPDWNDDPPGKPDGQDPLIFSMTDRPAKTIRNWAEQHESLLTEFDLYDNGEKVTLSRTLDKGTMTLFLDLDGDGTLSDGTEWLFDQHENAYQILSRELIDSDQNGWFDYTDDLWHIAMIKNGDGYHHVSEIGILGFNWSNAEHYKDDFLGNGRYADCLWEGDPMIHLYPDCEPVSEEHFRILAYNEQGIVLEGGRTVPTYGALMGHLDMSGN